MSAARYAVFGQSIAHSQSPRIHAAFAKAQGIALDYRAIEASPQDFAAALEAFAADDERQHCGVYGAMPPSVNE